MKGLYIVIHGLLNLRMFSFVRSSLVQNSPESIVLKFKNMDILIFENDLEKSEDIDVRVRTHDTGIHLNLMRNVVQL